MGFLKFSYDNKRNYKRVKININLLNIATDLKSVAFIL